MINIIQSKKPIQAVILTVLSIVFACSLSACGGTNTNGNKPAPAESPAPATAPAATTPAEPETAKLSGKLVVYSAGPAGLAEKIQAGFEAKTGVQLEMFQGTTGKIMARMEAEKANPVVDVVILASLPSAIGMMESGLTLPYKEAVHGDKLIPAFSDPDGHYFSYSLSALGIAYNTKNVTSPPQQWSDLLQAEWEGKINIPDPAQSGSALDFISGFIHKHGDAGWDYFEQVKDNEAMIAGANQEALDPVISGAKDIVLASVDYMTFAAKAKGEPIDLVYPADGTVISPRPAMIMNTSKNQDNAKAYIDYLLSDEAQKMITDAFLLSGRSDIQEADRPGANDIPTLPVDYRWMNEQQNDVSKQFTELFKK